MPMGEFKVTGNAIYHIMRGDVDLDADQMTAVLLDQNHVWDDAHDVWSDISANEVDGSGAGFPDYNQIAVTGQVVTKILNGGRFDINDLDWGDSVSITGKWAYIVVGAPGALNPTDILLCGADQNTDGPAAVETSTNGDFDVSINAGGVFDNTRNDP